MTLSSAGAWCAVTRPWMTEVWSRDCISYQSSDDVGIMSRVFYWVLFWDCCWWCNVVIRQWQGLEADQPSGRPFTPFCSQLLSGLGMLLITGHRHLATSWHMSAVSTQWETRPVHCGIFGANRRTFNYGAKINIVDSSLRSYCPGWEGSWHFQTCISPTFPEGRLLKSKEMASREHEDSVSLVSYSALLGPVLALCALVTFTLAS